MTLARALLLLLLPATLAAQQPVKARPFGLLSRATFFDRFVPNRTTCSITPVEFSEISTTTQTCGWPAGTSNTYLFSGGLQVAGIIGADGGVWAGDTTGGFFFDIRGATSHGEALENVHRSDRPEDRADWPAEAQIPSGPDSWYYSGLQGQLQGSNLDAWSMAWEGNAARRGGRQHPLGIAVETRHLGWRYPRGNDDIQYVLYTIYNITAADPAAYAAQRPEIRDRLVKLGVRFQARVSDTLGIQLPPGGYTLASWFASFTADPDVGDAGSNYLTANVPLATMFAYDHRISRAPGWTFDLRDHGPPFFTGSGFFGLTALRAPDGSDGVQVISGYGGGGGSTLGPPRDVLQLYRYLAGTQSAATGDQPCSYGDPLVTHLCYFNGVSATDVRGAISVRGAPLPPGGSATFALALTFAAPFGSSPPADNVLFGDPRRLLDPVQLAAGANRIDSLSGFQGYTDLNGDGVVQGGEIRAAPRSMLGKVQLARTLFETRFLLPQAPAAPDFFLVPGDNQVTVLWKPSVSETSGDAYFASASTPTIAMPEGVVPNPLYDPNYRQFDVEGYRVYRGRANNPAELVLLAQFDYTGTVLRDYTGRINPRQDCAPELGVRTGCPELDSLVAGQSLAGFVTHNIAYEVIQLRDGDRIRDPNGVAYLLAADTLGVPTGPGTGCLCDTGVPFQFVDRTARNGFSYFYLVTAFDVNSYQSAPSSMESNREGRLRTARPARPASNVVSEGEVTVTYEGRGRALNYQDSVPTVDESGRFSGPFPPANGWEATPLNFVREIFSGTQEARLRLDSLALGQTDLSGCCSGGMPGIPIRYFFTLSTPQDVTHLTIPVDIPYNFSSRDYAAPLDLFSSDPVLSAQYGGAASPLRLDLRLRYPHSSEAFDWGMAFLASGNLASRLMNGARWFDGPSPAHDEVLENPTSGNCANSSNGCLNAVNFNNAGALTGVVTVYQPHPYMMFNREWRNMSQSQLGAHRAADYNAYWGQGGRIDSVVDVTHNVAVPFSTEAGGTWGVLNTSAQGNGGHDGRPSVLTPTDWTCVEPFRSRLTQPTSTIFPCASATPFSLNQQAELGQIAFGAGDNQSTANAYSVRNPLNLAPQPGFALYLAGTITQFSLSTLPQPGTVWSMRDYVGTIMGTVGSTFFNWSHLPRPLTAVGTELVVRTSATNTIATVRDRDLRLVHTVPDPFYYEAGLLEGQGVRFVNLPTRATIRIYTAGGVLLRILDHQPASQQGDTFWDLRTRNGQRVASGVYFYHIESSDARRVGRMTIVNYTD